MPKKAKPGSAVDFGRRSWALVVPTLILIAGGCQERDRLTFPDPGDGIGPVTTIDQPSQSDTTVPAGPEFFVNGRTIDLDGVDTVYFQVIGANQNFQPFRPNPPTDTVRFGLPLSTSGHTGDTFTVRIHGVDSEGNSGSPSTRLIIVR